jgi:hypothetical protein
MKIKILIPALGNKGKLVLKVSSENKISIQLK